MNDRYVWARRAAVLLLAVDIISWLFVGANGPARPKLGAPLQATSAPTPGAPPQFGANLAGPGRAGGLEVSYMTPTGGGSRAGAVLCFLSATTPAARSRGLAGHPGVSIYAGVVLVYRQPSTVSHTTAGFPAPTTLIFVNGRGQVVTTTTAPPCPTGHCPLYAPTGPYRYVLELPTTGERLPITSTSTVQVSGPCGP